MDEHAFNDPVVRCMSCSNLLLRESITRLGCCMHCGNKRIINVRTLSEDEMNKLKERGISEDFLSLFEGVEDDDIRL